MGQQRQVPVLVELLRHVYLAAASAPRRLAQLAVAAELLAELPECPPPQAEGTVDQQQPSATLVTPAPRGCLDAASAVGHQAELAAERTAELLAEPPLHRTHPTLEAALAAHPMLGEGLQHSPRQAACG